MTQATFLTPRCYRLVRRIHAHQVWVDARRWAASHLWHKSDFVFQSSRHYLWRHSSTLFLYLTLFAHFRSSGSVFQLDLCSTSGIIHLSPLLCFHISVILASKVRLPGAVRHFKCLACCTFRLSFGMSFMGSQTKLLVYSLFCADFGTVYCSCALAALSNVKATLMQITESRGSRAQSYRCFRDSIKLGRP